MGEALFDLLNGCNLRLYAADDLRQQALNTVAVETPGGWRLAKEKAVKKIDAIVALAIARVAAIEDKPKTVDAAALEAVVQLNASLTRANPWGTIQSSNDFDDEEC